MLHGSCGQLSRHSPDERPDPPTLKQHRSGNRSRSVRQFTLRKKVFLGFRDRRARLSGVWGSMAKSPNRNGCRGQRTRWVPASSRINLVLCLRHGPPLRSLFVDLCTVKALGLMIPPLILARADEVIE
jgi:hypothetical protein